MHIAKKILPLALGALAGFAYWYFIGCLNGSCPITGKWYTSTLYGTLVGASWLLPGKKKVVPADPGAAPADQKAGDERTNSHES